MNCSQNKIWRHPGVFVQTKYFDMYAARYINELIPQNLHD